MATRSTGREKRSERVMARSFALGSTCFLVAPFPGYAELAGPRAVALTFFVGSLLFTAGAAAQARLAAPLRRAGYRAAVVQLAGTLLFNVSTFRALWTVLDNPGYDRLVWRPDAFGSICFLASGVIAYRASSGQRGTPGWWQPLVNLVGCVFFGIAAVAGYVLPRSDSMLGQAAANWNTSAGAACFLACAVGAHRSAN